MERAQATPATPLFFQRHVLANQSDDVGCRPNLGYFFGGYSHAQNGTAQNRYLLPEHLSKRSRARRRA